jgi:hypothetical protein
LRGLAGLFREAGDFGGGELVRRCPGHQIAVLVVVGRHLVSGLPVPARGVGRRHLRREDFQGQHPGGGRVPRQRYRPILGKQDSGRHRAGRAARVLRGEFKQQLRYLAERDRDFPFMPAEHAYVHGRSQLAGVHGRGDDGGDRPLSSLQQPAAA